MKKKAQLFLIKPYFKHELAALYGLTRKSFMNQVHNLPDLAQELHQIGYTIEDRLLTPYEVETIIQFIGMPETKSMILSANYPDIELKSYASVQLAALYG